MVRCERFFRPSRFGTLVPHRIVFESFQRFSHPKSGQPSFSLTDRETFTYDTSNASRSRRLTAFRVRSRTANFLADTPLEVSQSHAPEFRV